MNLSSKIYILNTEWIKKILPDFNFDIICSQIDKEN